MHEAEFDVAPRFHSARLELEQQAAGDAWEEEEEDSADEGEDAEAKAIYGPTSEEDAIGAMPVLSQRQSTLRARAYTPDTRDHTHTHARPHLFLPHSHTGELDPEAREEARVNVDEAERLRLRREFVEMMQERFLRGEDGEFFDYSTVDDDPDLDDLDQVSREAEEAYFDAD